MKVNNKTIHFDDTNIYTNDVAGKPMTPSKWVSDKPSYKKVTRIKITCGGGMGGASWYEVIDRIDLNDLMQRSYIVTKNWEGKEIGINLSYVVKAEQFTLATAILDSQNGNYVIGHHQYNWLIEDDHKIKLSDNFGEYGK